MDRTELEKYIAETYGVTPDYPWIDSPNYGVFRHPDSKKWFALIMDIPREKLCPGAEGTVDIVNLKCDTIIPWNTLSEKGIYPAYHMNKQHWISAMLDEVDGKTLEILVDVSYVLTSKKYTKAKKRPEEAL